MPAPGSSRAERPRLHVVSPVTPRAADVLADAVLRPITANAFESTVEQLASAVRLGVFVDGEQLPPERELAARLGIGRHTLREAIAALRELGLLTTTRGRGGGSVVTYSGHPPVSGRAVHPSSLPSQSAPGMSDALDFRRVVEPGAAALAARRTLTGEQRAFLDHALHEATQPGASGARRVADSRLHLAIVTLSGSAMLIDAVTRAQSALDALLRRIPVLAPNIQHSDCQHRAIVRHILAGREDEAREAMLEHVDGTAALLRGLLG